MIMIIENVPLREPFYVYFKKLMYGFGNLIKSDTDGIRWAADTLTM